MKTRILSVLTGLLITSLCSFAQNETNHWMFGQNGGIDFSSGAPVPEPGCMLSVSAFTSEGTAAISDPITGNLLMYTNGVTVYASNHTVMPNGSGLLGHDSSTEAAIIVPKPGSSTLFYIFTTDADENNGAWGCNYSVVDMTLNGGLGDVIPTQKNILLFTPCGENLSAVKHANCTDWWIMAKEKGTTTYKAYLLTSTGVSDPVNSTVGVIFSSTGSGQTQFSSDGMKYAHNENTHALQLFDFDNATGLLSNPITLAPGFCGLSFSPDNSKLYATRVQDGTAIIDLYQYDLSSGNPATMVASETYIGTAHGMLQLQLGKDFKIYGSSFNTSNLSVINNPNELGLACGFMVESIPIAGSCSLGFCNFPDSYYFPCSPIEPEPDIPEEAVLIPQIPNIITPNGDGVNDVFQIDNLPPASSLEILNRWGNPVFTTDNYNNDWMGHNSDGIYFYMLKLPNGTSFSGFVHVFTDHY